MIQLYIRWGSSAVTRYAQEAHLGTTTPSTSTLNIDDVVNWSRISKLCLGFDQAREALLHTTQPPKVKQRESYVSDGDGAGRNVERQPP